MIIGATLAASGATCEGQGVGRRSALIAVHDHIVGGAGDDREGHRADAVGDTAGRVAAEPLLLHDVDVGVYRIVGDRDRGVCDSGERVHVLRAVRVIPGVARIRADDVGRADGIGLAHHDGARTEQRRLGHHRRARGLADGIHAEAVRILAVERAVAVVVDAVIADLRARDGDRVGTFAAVESVDDEVIRRPHGRLAPAVQWIAGDALTGAAQRRVAHDDGGLVQRALAVRARQRSVAQVAIVELLAVGIGLALADRVGRTGADALIAPVVHRAQVAVVARVAVRLVNAGAGYRVAAVGGARIVVVARLGGPRAAGGFADVEIGAGVAVVAQRPLGKRLQDAHAERPITNGELTRRHLPEHPRTIRVGLAQEPGDRVLFGTHAVAVRPVPDAVGGHWRDDRALVELATAAHPAEQVSHAQCSCEAKHQLQLYMELR